LELNGTSAVDTVLQAFFTTGNGAVFLADKRIDVQMVSGRNEVYFKLPKKTRGDLLRIDPGIARGQYVLNSVELRR